MTANFNEDLFSSECQSSSMIQRTSEETESRESKTSGSRESQRMGGRKNFK